MKTRRGPVVAGLVPGRVPTHSKRLTLAMTRHALDVEDEAGAAVVLRPTPNEPVDLHGRNEFSDDARLPSWGPDRVASFVDQVNVQARAIEGTVAQLRNDGRGDQLVVRTLCSQGINRGPMLAHCLAGALRKRGALCEGEACNDVPLPQREHIVAYTRAFVEAPEGEEVEAMLATEA